MTPLPPLHFLLLAYLILIGPASADDLHHAFDATDAAARSAHRWALADLQLSLLIAFDEDTALHRPTPRGTNAFYAARLAALTLAQ